MEFIKLCILFYILRVSTPKEASLFDSHTDYETFLSNVCIHSAILSKMDLFYVINLNQNIDHARLIRTLHANDIATVTVDRLHEFHTCVGNEHVKNILFTLNDCSDVLNFMFGSMINHFKNASEHRSIDSLNDSRPLDERTLPNVCFHLGALTLRDRNRDCDMNITSSQEHFLDGAPLAYDLYLLIGDNVYDEVWNPDNFLIFAAGEAAGSNCDIRFALRLAWRVYKGRRTVICAGATCYRYDAFFDRVEHFTGASGEDYFDFSWRNMNGAPLISCILDSNVSFLESRTGYASWSNDILYVLGDFGTHRSAAGAVFNAPGLDIMPNTSLALLSDASLVLAEMNARLRWDAVKFRPTVATDHGSLCIFVPRRGFKPPYLAVLKSFSPAVWVCILVTIAVSLTAHRYHTSLQLRQPRLYTEAELTQYENLSSSLTIYRYFLGVAQPRLLLGRPTSGKILFCVFIFSALILTTLLQSRMVTLTSHQPRFADVNTMEELKDSGHLVQTARKSQDFRFLTADATFNWILERLSDSYYFSYEVLSTELAYDINDTIGYSDTLNNKTVELLRPSKSSAEKNIRAAMKSDAFASIRPSQMESRRWFFAIDAEEYSEYHCMEECLITYPHLYLSPSHTFAFAEFNAFLNKYFEAGILVNFKRSFMRDYDAALPSISTEDSAYWRPSSIKDIQIALICFIGGLLLSSVVFLCEIAWKF